MILLVAVRHEALGLAHLDGPDDGQAFAFLKAGATVLGDPEDLGRADVIGRRMQVDDEGAGEEVRPVFLVVQSVWDEDVREGRGRVSDVGPLLEFHQERADQAIDGRGITLRGVFSRLGKTAGIHRGVVRLVVDHQHGGLARPILQPVAKMLEDRLVLLHDEDGGGNPELIDPQTFRHRLPEIPGRLAARQGHDRQILVFGLRQQSHADALAVILVREILLGVEAEKPDVDAILCLGAEAVVHPCEDDDCRVTGIGRLTDQPVVVRRLAGLDVADDHAAPIPGT